MFRPDHALVHKSCSWLLPQSCHYPTHRCHRVSRPLHVTVTQKVTRSKFSPSAREEFPHNYLTHRGFNSRRYEAGLRLRSHVERSAGGLTQRLFNAASSVVSDSPDTKRIRQKVKF